MKVQYVRIFFEGGNSMKHTHRILIGLIISIIFLDSLQSNNQITSENLQTNSRSIEEDAFSAAAYLPLFMHAEEEYLKKNKIEPEIKCKNCTTRRLSMSEFWGGLVGKAIKDVVEGKDSFDKAKLILDGFLKAVSEGFHTDIINYMLKIVSETKQVCSHCHSSSWEQT